jgi:hypothetical protein
MVTRRAVFNHSVSYPPCALPGLPRLRYTSGFGEEIMLVAMQSQAAADAIRSICKGTETPKLRARQSQAARS